MPFGAAIRQRDIEWQSRGEIVEHPCLRRERCSNAFVTVEEADFFDIDSEHINAPDAKRPVSDKGQDFFRLRLLNTNMVQRY